ncbi:glycosyltransferase family 2 protein [Tsuneonella mangrovi]|uniref:glycosyltransferase family 2 protein n=1 Tax=Tsuneonella mangrovi TaxID=1982042 RepID=UPI000BA2054E|nr:glycosyltransferase family 2 protein [Tsuneonella mangrovi]
MTKLIIQIPAFNEADHLPETIACLPRAIPGVDTIEYLVIDDGSRDGTSEVARSLGVHHVVRHRRNRGLAAAFRSGIEAALAAGADVIVNTDADNQYEGADIAALVQPILDGSADVVIGDRGVGQNAHFGPLKRLLQRLGSATVRRLSRVQVDDAVSGFRAMSREAAGRIYVTTEFSYTTEMLIQAGRKRMAVTSVPVRTNGPIRPSRLFSSIPQFIVNTGTTILRAYAQYNALKIFAFVGALLGVIGAIPVLRFLYFFLDGKGDGHLQSLVLGVGLLVLGFLCVMLGILADLVSANRKLLEQLSNRVRRIEDNLDD